MEELGRVLNEAFPEFRAQATEGTSKEEGPVRPTIRQRYHRPRWQATDVSVSIPLVPAPSTSRPDDNRLFMMNGLKQMHSSILHLRVMENNNIAMSFAPI